MHWDGPRRVSIKAEFKGEENVARSAPKANQPWSCYLKPPIPARSMKHGENQRVFVVLCLAGSRFLFFLKKKQVHNVHLVIISKYSICPYPIGSMYLVNLHGEFPKICHTWIL